MDDWIWCEECDNEFKVLSDSTNEHINYCPFCGTDIEDEEDDDIEEYDED